VVFDTVLASHELDNGGGGSFLAHVSPDGTQVAYQASVGGFFGTYIVSTAGGAARLLKGSKTVNLGSDWSLDSRSLIGECRPTSLGNCTLDPSGDAARVLLSDPKGGEFLYPSYSWDGRG
jgi:hypothetical protein